MRLSLILTVVLVCLTAQSEVPNHGFSEAENQMMNQANSQTAIEEFKNPTLFTNSSPLSLELIDETDARPFAEYEETGYLIFSYNYSFSSRKAKLTMAENLPKAVQLIIFSDSKSSSEARRIKNEFGSVIDKDRITVIYTPGASRGFWARDSVPVPVFRTPKLQQGQDIFTVVDARYSRFEQDEVFSQHFQAEMTRYRYYFEGGNFMANARHECLVVNKTATAQMPDRIFQDHYGCRKLVRLPYVKGIGHADESVKFIDDNTVFTDETRYVSILEEAGYDVVQLPRPKRKYETYVNSLLINGTMLSYLDQSRDEDALQIYRDAGFKKVIGINTEVLSNDGLGSIHCITMTYPPVEMSELLHSVGGAIVD